MKGPVMGRTKSHQFQRAGFWCTARAINCSLNVWRDVKLDAAISRSEWLLDPDYTFLNHGSYGATPRTVIAEQDRWRERVEQHPTGFMTYELPRALRDA